MKIASALAEVLDVVNLRLVGRKHKKDTRIEALRGPVELEGRRVIKAFIHAELEETIKLVRAAHRASRPGEGHPRDGDVDEDGVPALRSGALGIVEAEQARRDKGPPMQRSSNVTSPRGSAVGSVGEHVPTERVSQFLVVKNEVSYLIGQLFPLPFAFGSRSRVPLARWCGFPGSPDGVRRSP